MATGGQAGFLPTDCSMSHLILKTTPQSIITPILPMKPFKGSERGSDSAKVTQLEGPRV